MRKLFYITVEGSGDFPFDMLRYDSCYPLTSEDASQLYPDKHERRCVQLVSQDNDFTPDRWSSFGWKMRSGTKE